jgi:predicted AAA+ superfamily ATPase
MRVEVFKRIISEWQERPLPEVMPREIEVKPTKERITAIVGPRRAGKTYLMFYIIKNLVEKVGKEKIIFIDFEDNRLVGLKNEELDEIFVAHRELTGKEPEYLFFDEIQNIKYWSKFIRRLHNLNKYSIVVSGSSSKLLTGEIATELRGRYRSVLVLPFTFTEFLKAKGFSYTKMTAYTEKKGGILRHFNNYLSYGGFPEVVKAKTEEEMRELARTYYDTIFYRDILERYKIKNKEIIEMLMAYITDNNASIFSISSFEKIMKERGVRISKKTVSQYLRYLEESFFVFSLEKFSYSPKTRMINPKKVYIVDNVFHTFLSTTLSPNKGKLLEALVARELKRRGYNLGYFKEKNECNFIVSDGKKIVAAVQVTYEINERNKKRELNGLAEALEKLKIKNGLVLTYDQKENLLFKNKRIKVLPVWEFLMFPKENAF